MATQISSSNTEFDVMNSGDTYLLDDDAVLNVTNAHGIFGGSGFSDVTFQIKGQIIQSGNGFAGIEADGTDMTVKVYSGASITGTTGVIMNGANAHLSNSATIRGLDGAGLSFGGPNAVIVNNGNIFSNDSSSAAVEAFGPDSTLTSNGKIQGGYGINVTDAKVTINLGHNSNVIGSHAAIYSENTEETDKITLTNEGKITGKNGGEAIHLGDSDDKITNHGTITGTIYMGTGKDTFDNRGGHVDHAIQGGAGDDTLITDDASVKLKENGGSEGNDTVKSTVTYTLSANVENLYLLGSAKINGAGTNLGDHLYGNSGANKLYGFKGVDTLDGGKGNDFLTGGDNSDTFVFKTGYAHDTIKDFENGIDKFDVRGWSGMDNINDIKDHMTSSHGDVHITLGSDELIIADTSKAEINSGDFMFHS